MSSYMGSKIFTCSLCGQERKGNIQTDRPIMCWHCVHVLNSMPKEKRKGLYSRLKDDIKKELVGIFVGDE